MKQVLLKSGTAQVQEVPAPLAGTSGILVRVRYSCISTGTELSSVTNSGMSLYRRVLKQPEQARRMLGMIRDQGFRRTLNRVQGKLAAGNASGYSAAGEVIAVGETVEGFSVGDRVACAGAGIACHAEIIAVPVNLAAKVPDCLALDEASTVTLGSIAMQGVRRAQPTLGETIVVVGLGVLGQIVAQLLTANGCRVIGVDTDQHRIDLALQNGLANGLNAATDNYCEVVRHATSGFGADAVIITAASSTDQIVSDAAIACRKKGRIVLVGDVGLHLRRSDFYTKEIDFLISCSYGPGRYDPVYEEDGHDYPLPYVRWTENRNMDSYLYLVAQGRVRLRNLIGKPYEIDQAPQAYSDLQRAERRPVIAILSYPDRPEALQRVIFRTAAIKADRIRVGLIGAGSFAQGMHLPNMVRLRRKYQLYCVASRTGATAKAVAEQFGASFSTTEYERVLESPDVDLVLIATRHNLHARLALEALHAGKHVLVEKPLAMNDGELAAIAEFFAGHDSGRLLCTGFNRRFSPAMRKAKDLLADVTTPLIVNYRMNAGYTPLTHWIHGLEGGGRNIGEACHIYDLFNYLTGSRVCSVDARSIAPHSKQWTRNDNFVAVIGYEDGSICTLTYTAQGSSQFPKEQMEIFAGGFVISMDDFKCISIAGSRRSGWASKFVQKGQLEELEAVANTLCEGADWPISLEDQLQATSTSFDVERQIWTTENHNQESAAICAE